MARGPIALGNDRDPHSRGPVPTPPALRTGSGRPQLTGQGRLALLIVGLTEGAVLQTSGENALTCENVRTITYSGTYLA